MAVSRPDGRGEWIVIYDGECRLCQASVARLKRWVGPGVRFVPLQDPSIPVLAPSLDPAAARARIHLVAPGGRIFGGAEAVVRLLQTSSWRWVVWPYFLPLVRPLVDAVYAWIARNRYIFGRSRHAGCDGHCRLE